MTTTRYKRRIKLILPGLQLRLVGKFVGIAVLAMLLQFLVLGSRLVMSLGEVDGVGGDIAAQVPGVLLQTLAISLLTVVPAMVGLGVLFTFRIAGPLYRFQQHLDSVARGDSIGECRIRKGDELQFLCDTINAATERIHSGDDEAAQTAGTELETADAA